jgi:hypothetical protein
VAIHVAVMANSDFAAAFGLVAMIVDGLHGKGASAVIEQGLGVWEEMMATGANLEQAREAVAAWVEEQLATITVTGEAVEEREGCGSGCCLPCVGLNATLDPSAHRG